MKRIMLSVLLCLVAVAPAFAQTASSKAEQEVLKVVDEVLAALVKRAAAALERALTDDYYTVYDGGQVGDRARVIASLKSTTSGWDAWERGETRIKLHGETALVLSQNKAKGHNPRGSFEGHWQMTTVLVRERGQWRVAAAQFTTIKPPAAPAQQ